MPSSRSNRERKAPKRSSLRSRGLGTSTSTSSEMSPLVSTTTRSASSNASSTSWVTSRTVGRWRRHSSCTSACILMRVSASSAPNGSSSSSSCGSRTSARASAARCASPPESVLGQSLSWPASPTSDSASRPRDAAAEPFCPRITLDSTDAHGSSRGSWKTTARCCGDEDVAAGSGVEACKCPQQRGFSRAAAPEHGDELARPDIEVQARRTLREPNDRVSPRTRNPVS